MVFFEKYFERKVNPFHISDIEKETKVSLVKTPEYNHEQLVRDGEFTAEDLQEIKLRRHDYTQLGYAYQLAFIKILNRLPQQEPFEVDNEILNYVAMQLKLANTLIETYLLRQATCSEHQEQIRKYLGLQRLNKPQETIIETFLYEEACRLEQTNTLLVRVKEFLKQQRILRPTNYTLKRYIIQQREKARQYIYSRLASGLSEKQKKSIDSLLTVSEGRISEFQRLKENPKRATPKGMLRLTSALETIKATGVLEVDTSWLNNNYQRTLTRYAKRCSVNRLRDLKPKHRYAVMVCFLWQTYQDTVDYMIDMHGKLLAKVNSSADKELDTETRRQRKLIRNSLKSYQGLGKVMLDESLDAEQFHEALFKTVSRDKVKEQLEGLNTWLDGKYSHTFKLVIQRHSYLREFSPSLLKHLEFHLDQGSQSTLPEAIDLIKELNETNKRKLPDDVPIDFLSKPLQKLVLEEGVSKASWECALLTSIDEQIKAGNLSLKRSKRFGRFDDFFIPKEQWHSIRESFFKRANLPCNPDEVKPYLTNRLNRAYDRFLEQLPNNTYAQIDEKGWKLSTDKAEKLSDEQEENLDKLKQWLSENMRTIKLPELLIEVDNSLSFTKHFMTSTQQEKRESEDVCLLIATIMAHGCNIGSYTMSRLTDVSYAKIKRVTDWQLTEEAQRAALAVVVNAISNLSISKTWGEGKTSSSDGQRFALNRKVLQQTYSHSFNDFALEFYSFIADNYAPFYSDVIECTDRDAPYVLDGHVYNESDLALEEHYTDTHGYTEINFTAFAMIGKRFAPRIRGLKKQRIYRIDTSKNYKPLTPLIKNRDHIIHMDWITDKWDQIGHFHASFEYGHTTASTALKRLNSFTKKNHFYRANRELGRIFKTEHILSFMSDPLLRRRNRRGLLKVEQLHSMARDVSYAKRGTLNSQELERQRNTCSCLTLILASIIYWQAQEIYRIVTECNPEEHGIDLSLLEHISPIEWDNIILYGEYVLNRSLVKTY